MNTPTLDVEAPLEDATTTVDHARRSRARRRNVALGSIVAGAAVFSSGCTLGDVSTILSILRLLGIV